MRSTGGAERRATATRRAALAGAGGAAWLASLWATGCLAVGEPGGARSDGGLGPPYAELQALWDRRCAGGRCHVGAAVPAQGLDLSEGVSLEHLVGVPSRQAPSQARVEPGRPERSYLYAKLAGDLGALGDRMPVGASLPEEDLARVRAWIGAMDRRPRPDAGPSGATDAGGDAGPRDGGGAPLDAGEPPDAAPPPDRTAPSFAGLQWAQASGDTALELAWDPARDDVDPPAALRYRVYVGAGPGRVDYTTPALTTPAGAAGATLAGLAGSTSYSVAVRALDRAGNEDANTVERVAATPDRVPPSFGGALSATPSPSAVTLAWAPAVDDVTPTADLRYRVYQGERAGAVDFGAPVAVTPPGALEVSIGGLSPSTSWFFVVRAVDAAGNVDGNLAEVSATTPADADLSPPTFAGVASALARSSGEIELGWSPATDDRSAQSAISYRVYEAPALGAQDFAAPAQSTPPGATSAVLGGFAPQSFHAFVVRALDAAGNEEQNGVELSATTLGDTTPPSFAGLQSATALGPSQVELVWSAGSDDVTPVGALVYSIYGAAGTGAPSLAAPLAESAPGATAFTVGGLASSTQYAFVVRARDAAGNEDANAAAQTVTTANLPPTFAGLASATAASATSVALSWSPATDDATAASALVYLVHRAERPGGEDYTTPTYVTAPGATAFTATGLAAGTLYYFVVRARDATGARDANTVERSATTLPPPPATLSGDVQPIFGASCTGSACHEGRNPAGGIALDTAAAAYAALVGQPSAGCPPTPLVAPGVPADSYLTWKLEGTGPCFQGSQMPKAAPPLSAAERALIASWIADGAPNN